MGEEINKPNRESSGLSTGDKGNGTNSTSTSTSSKGSSTGAGGTGAGGTGRNEATEKVVPVMALVDEEEQKRNERNAKRRERYAKQKAENGETVKPKKVRKKTTAEPETISKDSLNMMIAGLSSVIASRPNCEHWLLSEPEINSITTPLCKMLEESEAFKNIGQYSNQIALITACLTVFMPRIIVTLSKQKEKKERAITGNTTKTNVTRTDGKNPTKPNPKPVSSGRPDKRDSAPASANNGDNVPWYGNPLA